MTDQPTTAAHSTTTAPTTTTTTTQAAMPDAPAPPATPDAKPGGLATPDQVRTVLQALASGKPDAHPGLQTIRLNGSEAIVGDALRQLAAAGDYCPVAGKLTDQGRKKANP